MAKSHQISQALIHFDIIPTRIPQETDNIINNNPDTVHELEQWDRESLLPGTS